jgi:general secretion pathway protein G
MNQARKSVLSRRRRGGMSLVEIMVVIAIIGGLMTVIAVNVIDRLDQANQQQTAIQIKKIEEVLTISAASHHGKFPTTSEGLDSIKSKFPNGEVPKDAWQNAFQYFSPGTHGQHDYEIISLGKDGKEGGDGYNSDINSWEPLNKE